MTQTLERSTKPLWQRRKTQSAAMIDYLRSIILSGPCAHERFHAIFLDEQSAYLADHSLGQGDLTSLKLRMRELFGAALSVGASGIIIAHNHPSGNCRPSWRDIESTKRLKEIAIALDIRLIDHLIITESEAYSMRAGGDL